MSGQPAPVRGGGGKRLLLATALTVFTGLLLGGVSQRGLASSSGTWSGTGSMAAPGRYAQTATLLHDGRVLVAGGFRTTVDIPPLAINSAELYNPATGAWTQAAPMMLARGGHTASLLANGTVLVVGGQTQDGSCSLTRGDSELYDPVADRWTLGPSLQQVARHTATTLADGRVVLLGGVGPNCLLHDEGCDYNGSWVTTYDPVSNTMSNQATNCLPNPRERHASFLQADGTVLVVGGENPGNGGGALYMAASDVFNPATGSWSSTGSLATGRSRMIAVQLGQGRILAAGGITQVGLTSSAEVFDPATGNWSATGSMAVARAEASAATLADGTILASGGVTAITAGGNQAAPLALASAELFDASRGQWVGTDPMAQARGQHTLTALAGARQVLAAGGTSDLTSSLASAELYGLPAPPTPTPKAKLTTPTPTPTPVACGQNPSLVVTPAVVVLGHTTRVSGTGFCPGPVTVTWLPGASRGDATSDASGSFALTMLVFPRDIVGPRTLTAGAPSAVATAALLVVAPPVEPPAIQNSPLLILRR